MSTYTLPLLGNMIHCVHSCQKHMTTTFTSFFCDSFPERTMFHVLT